METDKQFNRLFYIPKPVLKPGLEVRRYNLLMLLLYIPFKAPAFTGVPWNDEVMNYACAAGIRMMRKTAEGCFALPSVRRVQFTPANLLFEFWEADPNRTTKLFVFGDSRAELSYYVYTGSEYEPVNELQIKKLIREFVKAVFGELVPKTMSTESCRSEFLTLLTIRDPISTSDKKHLQRDGLPFNNVYATVQPEPQNDKLLRVVKVDYTADSFYINRLEANYQSAEFVVEPETSGDSREITKLVVSDEFLDFLPKLTRNSRRLEAVVRGFLRSLVMSPSEGHMYQTCFYLYGPPSSGKSELIKFFENFVGDENVQHLTRHYNQFSGGQLKGCRLLVIDDVQKLKAADIDLIKPLLGRDAIPYQRKYDPMIHKISPTCQVVMVSNHPPESFPLLLDEGVQSNLIVVGLSDLSKLSEDERVPDFHKQAKQFSTELLNWALHTPAEDLRHHIRAEYYHKTRDLERAQLGHGLPSFVSECLMYSDTFEPTPFFTANDMLTAIADYAELVQDVEIMNMLENIKGKGIAATICKQISKLLLTLYGKDCPYGRYSKNDDRFQGARPNGIKYLARKGASGDLPKGFEEIVPVVQDDRKDTRHALECSPQIVAMKDINSGYIAQPQRKVTRRKLPTSVKKRKGEVLNHRTSFILRSRGVTY